MGIENLLTYMVSALFFVMTPGMDTVFVLNKSIGQGRKSGVYATLGVNTGVLTHTFLAAIGVSVLLSKSVLAFSIIKYAGACYLIYAGYLKLKNNIGVLSENTEKEQAVSSKNDFWSGFITNSLNPKVALFFLAFFPQFVTPSQIDNPIPYLLLGFTYAVIGIVWYLILTLFASEFSEKIRSNPKTGIWIGRVSGLVFILMGLKIALSN
ncbi:LysE family translocator [Postechiella marina]